MKKTRSKIREAKRLLQWNIYLEDLLATNRRQLEALGYTARTQYQRVREPTSSRKHTGHEPIQWVEIPTPPCSL